VKKQSEIVLNASQLPLNVTVIGKDGKPKAYQMMPTRNYRGAQLCAAEK